MQIKVIFNNKDIKIVSVDAYDCIDILKQYFEIEKNQKIIYVYDDTCILPFFSFSYYDIHEGCCIHAFSVKDKKKYIPITNQDCKTTHYPSLREVVQNAYFFELEPNAKNSVILYDGFVKHNYSSTIARIKDQIFAKFESKFPPQHIPKNILRLEDVQSIKNNKVIIPSKSLKPSTESLPKFW